jgi:hypothetical protein
MPSPPAATPAATPGAAIRLRLLNGFALSCDGDVVPLQPCPQRLVAYLALQRRPAMRPLVASRLWLTTTEERATASLRTALWRLRRTVGNVVEVSGTTLRLNPEVAVDVHEANLVARRILEVPDGHAATAADLTLFGGELLPQWWDDWVLFERERLRQLWLHASSARPSSSAMPATTAARSRRRSRPSRRSRCGRAHTAVSFRSTFRRATGRRPFGTTADTSG